MWTILEKSFRQIGTLLWLVINRFMWKNRQSEPESEVSHGIHSGKHYLFRFLCFCRKRMNTLWQRSQLHQLERNIEGSIRIIKILYQCFELTTLSCPVLYFLCYLTEIVSHQLGSIPVARFAVTSLAKEPSFLSSPQKNLMWEMVWSFGQKNISVRKWL